MLADQTRLENVAGYKRQKWRAAARRFRIRCGSIDKTLQPDLALVGVLRGQPVSAHQRMRESPDTSSQLPQRLGHPTRQREVIKIPKDHAVLTPKPLQWRIG